ncbi:MAG TPA: hypothetical protein P5210_13640 [Draconibacterium sp.]|nr:hypothetical protein [Draconibacterium sp.]HRX12696.1 hypothetical protein [Draconibacterium sp.]
MALKGIHTGSFFNLIAGLIIFAHAVVPHHHHFDTIDSHPEHLECENTKPDKHDENPDSHCHAFNVFISEKAGNLPADSPAQTNYCFDHFYNESSQNIKVNVNTCFKICYFETSLQKQLFQASRPLRAPPAIA